MKVKIFRFYSFLVSNCLKTIKSLLLVKFADTMRLDPGLACKTNVGIKKKQAINILKRKVFTHMAQTARKPEIVSIARREGMVTVEGLVSRFGVTPQTIRRDLTELADEGQLERVHGGALLPSKTTNIGYNERRGLNQSAKVDIARACAKEIPNNCSVFLNIGTTTEAVAAELFHHEGLLVVTNNLNIATELSGADGIELVVTGGNFRRSDGGLIGDLAKQTIRQFRFDYAIIGCSALHESGDILDYDFLEVGVSKEIIDCSEHVFLVADATKFDRKAPARIASLSSVEAFFTDRDPPARTKAVCNAADTLIFVAPASG